MWFSTLILRNALRRPLRCALTVLAVAIAIGCVVSLVGIANGFEHSFVSLYEKTEVDLIVTKDKGVGGLNSAIDESLGEKLKVIPGVKHVLPGLVDVVGMPDLGLHQVVLQGWLPETAIFDHVKLKEGGRALAKDDKKVMLVGELLANNMGKKVGDKVDVMEGETFEIVGVYESFNVFENGALIMPMRELQRIMVRPNQVTGLSMILEKPGDLETIEKVRSTLKTLAKGVIAMSARDHVTSLTEIRLAKAMAWATSFIAMVIGVFMVMNTMLMSVQERIREIGILRAVGWVKRRVLVLILGEAVVLSAIGAVLGIIMSIVLVRSLTLLPNLNGLIEGRISPMLVVSAIFMAVGLGLLGGYIPARQASRMLPVQALRNE